MKERTSSIINWEQKCWKYFKIDRFLESIENGYIYFASANQFEDVFEGATFLLKPQSEIEVIKRFDMIDHAFKELKRLTKISCWHKADYENIAMWKLYAADKKGIAITTTPQKMKEAFKPYKIESEYCEEEIYIGNVEYVDLTTRHLNETMLDIFYYKHLMYAYENELRLVISLRIAEEFGVDVPEKGIYVEVDFSKLIDDIILGPDVSISERNKLMQFLRDSDLESKIEDSCLTYRPIFF